MDDEHLREVAAGRALSLAEAARKFPASRLGRPMKAATVRRYAEHGVRTADGRRVRLAAVRVGRRLWIPQRAVADFIAAQQQPPADAAA